MNSCVKKILMSADDAFIAMFWGSIVVGIALAGQNLLVDNVHDLYLISATSVYGALFMALWMVLLMFGIRGGVGLLPWTGTAALLILVGLALRQQWFVDDKQWLRRMIPHHATAIHTSKLIARRTQNKDIRVLARSIVKSQEAEIALMQRLLNNTE